MRTLLFVAVGGAFGSSARYLVGTWMKNVGTLPWGTTAVNVAGSFALGVLAGVLADGGRIDADLRTGLTVGVLGGFTTFSTWTVESMELIGSGKWSLAAVNIFGALAVGLLAAGLGLALGRAA